MQDDDDLAFLLDLLRQGVDVRAEIRWELQRRFNAKTPEAFVHLPPMWQPK